MTSDYVVVGAGLTGSTIARALADAGRDVIVVDRRSHMGGNVHDFCHPSGIRVHTYGPHYFRTTSDKIWEYVNRFSSFYTYEAALKSLVDGVFENWPITGSYIRQHIGENWQPSFTGTPENFEQASLAMMPEPVYFKFVKGYTEKQWGVPASQMETALARRFDVRHDDEPRLMRHKYQGIPDLGYAGFMSRMLAGIPTLLNYDYLKRRGEITARKTLIYTGPIDEFYGFQLGRLKYRAQRREHEYLPDVDFVQPCGQINNPGHGDGPFIRTLEWKHMMPEAYAKRIRGTVLTREYPESPEDPNHYEYPFPDQQNQALYTAYRALANQDPNTLICGRLGEYKYFDMDQAIGHAQVIARRLLEPQ